MLIRASCSSPTSASARHTVGVEGTGPITGPRWRKPWKIADRLPTQDLRHRQINQRLTAVIDRVEPAPHHRRRQPGAQPGPLGQQPHRQRPSEPDQAIIITDEFQPVSPR
ncbi:MAG: hypothetical protein LC700_04220, partial [Actinobacteria bacterium]|nr:hypothetical protein [Actinomycetota bacterium]